MSEKKSDVKKTFLERMDKFITELMDKKKDPETDPKKLKLEGTLAEGVVKETGVKVAAEAFEKDKELFVTSEEGDFMLAPEGTYELEDGMIITVDVDGMIVEVVKADPKPEEMSDEEKAPITRKEFTEVTEKLFEAISKIGVKKEEMSAQEKADADKEKADSEAAKLEALKMKLAEKKKKLGAKDEKKDDDELLPENFGEKKRPFVNENVSRTEKEFADFDW